MTSGEDVRTRSRVRGVLISGGPTTASSLASSLGLSPAAVRRHLDAMEAEGLITTRDQRVHNPTGTRGRGRPAREYILTDAGRDAGPQAYDDLASEVLAFLADHAGTDAVEAFARTRAERQAERYAGARTPDELAAALTADGFAAGTRPAPGGTVICQHRCPVEHVAAHHPALCEAETAMLADVLGRRVIRLATIANGDGVCTTLVPDAVPQTTSTEAS